MCSGNGLKGFESSASGFRVGASGYRAYGLSIVRGSG